MYAHHGADEKLRFTLEARQGVLNYFSEDPSVRPAGMQLPSLLVGHGVQCRISNISKDRMWVARKGGR